MAPADLLLDSVNNIRLSASDRESNLFIAGMPRSGMATLFAQLVVQDLATGAPAIVFDPYGGIADYVIDHAADVHLNRLSYVDIGNTTHPAGINIFEPIDERDKREIVNTIINLMYDVYDPNRTGLIGPRFEHAVRHAAYTIMYKKGTTLIELARCLSDSSYVEKLLPLIADPLIKDYWTNQIAKTSDFHKSEVLDYIMSKFGRLMSDPLIRNVLGQQHSTIDIKKIVEAGKTIIFDFRALRRDYEAITIMSALLGAKITQYLRRERHKEVSLFFYEGNYWPTSVIRELLEEGRHYHTRTTVSASRVAELNTSVRDELLRSGTLMSFRTATVDAEIIARELHANVSAENVWLLRKYHAYLKLFHQGEPMPTRHLNLSKSSPERFIAIRDRAATKETLHREYGVERTIVEGHINGRFMS